MSADTNVPGAVNPQAFNRYAYTFNNPLRYVDPNGHCPAPPKDSGNVICVDLFISTEYIENRRGYGDNRSFDSNSDPKRSRAYIYITVDDNGKVVKVSEPQVNPSCVVGAGCWGPTYEYEKIDVTQADDGTINVSWKLKNGFAGHWLRIAEAVKATRGNPAIPLILAGQLDDDIDGNMQIKRDREGKYQINSLNRDPYPSLEVYYYEYGQWKQTIDRRSEWPSGYPSIGLKPDAPRDYIPAVYLPRVLR
jgi:hypothetical protein